MRTATYAEAGHKYYRYILELSLLFLGELGYHDRIMIYDIGHLDGDAARGTWGVRWLPFPERRMAYVYNVGLLPLHSFSWGILDVNKLYTKGATNSANIPPL